MEKIVRYHYSNDSMDVLNVIAEISEALEDFGLEIEEMDGDDGYEEFKIKHITEDRLTKLDKCTRVEVIDESGRAYVNWDSDKESCVEVSISMQDNERTLKVFINKKTTKDALLPDDICFNGI